MFSELKPWTCRCRQADIHPNITETMKHNHTKQGLLLVSKFMNWQLITGEAAHVSPDVFISQKLTKQHEEQCTENGGHNDQQRDTDTLPHLSRVCDRTSRGRRGMSTWAERTGQQQTSVQEPPSPAAGSRLKGAQVPTRWTTTETFEWWLIINVQN